MSGALCVCMILKNARYLLPDALDTLIPLAKDIEQYVFIDTGSTDDSVAYLRSRLPAADILEIPWTDHFAEARNVALANVKTPWALFLDADERLAEESVPVLQHLLEEAGHLPEGIVCRRENLALDGSVVSWDALTRLLRVHPKLRFTGSVHERPVYFETVYYSSLLASTARPLRVQQRPDLRLLHIAVNPQERQNKTDYYLKLIQRERQQWPSPFLDYHWAISPHIQKTISAEERLICLQQALKESLTFESAAQNLPYPQWAGVPVASCILECQFLLLEMDQRAEMLTFFEYHSPHALLAESWGQAALAYDLEEQWDQAQRCFYAAIDPQHPMADPSEGWGEWRCHAFLAVLYSRAKDWPAAWAHSRQALRQNPQPAFKAAMQDLQHHLSQQMPLPDAVQLLEQAFARAYAAHDATALLSLGCFLWGLKEIAKEIVFLRNWKPPLAARQTPFYAFFKALLKQKPR